ncbi:MAG: flagellar hook-length control protein FliK, partial [Alphaproteobacteria bacterium]|nr:flagellar hook-length control protein FliK [Alphaproteobacteria bacterium]
HAEAGAHGAAAPDAAASAAQRSPPPEPQRLAERPTPAEQAIAPVPQAAPPAPEAAAERLPAAPESRAPEHRGMEARAPESTPPRAPDPQPQAAPVAEVVPPPQANTTRSPPPPPTRQLLPVTVALLVSPGSQPAFSITLEPQELGRVEVRLARGADGETKLRITAERAETVALLARDQRDLQQGLALSGVPLANEAISIELAGGDAQREGRQDGQQRRQQQGGPEPITLRAENLPRSLLDMSI